MKLPIVKVKKPKGYTSTRILFSSNESAKKYVDSLNNQFLLKKAQMLEHPLSKRKEKLIKFAKSKKHLLTKQGKKYLLWEEI